MQGGLASFCCSAESATGLTDFSDFSTLTFGTLDLTTASAWTPGSIRTRFFAGTDWMERCCLGLTTCSPDGWLQKSSLFLQRRHGVPREQKCRASMHLLMISRRINKRMSRNLLFTSTRHNPLAFCILGKSGTLNAIVKTLLGEELRYMMLVCTNQDGFIISSPTIRTMISLVFSL